MATDTIVSADGPDDPFSDCDLNRRIASSRHPIPTKATELPLPLVYKHCIALTRSLYSFVRLLPAYSLYRRMTKDKTGALGIGYRLSTSRVMPLEEAGLEHLHSSGDMRRGISEYNFGSVDTPFGWVRAR